MGCGWSAPRTALVTKGPFLLREQLGRTTMRKARLLEKKRARLRERGYPISSYDDCVVLMEGIADPQAGRPIYDGHTRLVQRFDGQNVNYTIRYRGIDIVTYHFDGTVTLNAGNRPTQHIRLQFAWYSPFSVTSEEGKWLVWVDGEGNVPFRNGMRLMRPSTAREPDSDCASCPRQNECCVRIPGFSDQFPPESVCAVFN